MINNKQSVDKNEQVELIANTELKFFQTTDFSPIQFPAISFSLFWEKMKNADKIYAINVLMRNNYGKIVLNKNYLLGYGLYPASDWEIGKFIKTNQRILLPRGLNGEYKVYLRLIDATESEFVLDQIRSGTVLIPNKPIGEEIYLGNIKVF